MLFDQFKKTITRNRPGKCFVIEADFFLLDMKIREAYRTDKLYSVLKEMTLVISFKRC